MTVRRVLLSSALLLITAAWLRADTMPVDPDMTLDTGIGESAAIHDLTFSFFAQTGDDTFQFENVSGEPWFQLDIYTPDPGAAVNCRSRNFVGQLETDQHWGCEVAPVGSFVRLRFTAPEGLEIPSAGGHGSNAAHFSISLAPFDGDPGRFWPIGQPFYAGANGVNPVPEPGSLVLLLSSCGLVALKLARRRAV